MCVTSQQAVQESHSLLCQSVNRNCHRPTRIFPHWLTGMAGSLLHSSSEPTLMGYYPLMSPHVDVFWWRVWNFESRFELKGEEEEDDEDDDDYHFVCRMKKLGKLKGVIFYLYLFMQYWLTWVGTGSNHYYLATIRVKHISSPLYLPQLHHISR